MTAPKRIGIAVVEYAGKYLVGVRGPGVPLSGFAEFPGGKCASGESPSHCAVRECVEESGLQVVAERMLQRLEFEYPHGRVDLHFVLCHPANATDVTDCHREFRWVGVPELKTLRFPEANAGILDLLMNSIPLNVENPD